ncbi:MAG: NADH:ubiquinone oxidoreductase, subunit [Proteobacteria bacterium]|nr:NADH:ubiquinone oxidoreductase, subunit [Pseudomonadota bacterium]
MPPEATPREAAGPFAALRRLAPDSPARAFAIVIAVCVVCSVLVSSAAVVLAPIQHENALKVRQRQILLAAGLLDPSRDPVGQFSQVTPRMVDLRTGDYVEAGDPVDFDVAAESRAPGSSQAVPDEADVAKVRRRPDAMPVYLIERQGRVETVVLPVHGYGLWSTMYGFLALEGDGRTVKGITFYQHGETPGLGSEIDNPAWQARWVGKQALAADGSVLLRVVKGEPRGEGIEHQVDGLAGATLTARGVENLVHYWLGEQGFGPYLARLRAASGGAADET